jgi:hypothetical protein
MGSLICWFLGHDGWKWPSWLGGGWYWSWSWLGVRVVCQSARTTLPRTLGCLVARLPARCLLVTLVVALVPLDALLLGELIAQFARIDGPWSESSACGSRPRLFGIHFARLVAHFLHLTSLLIAPKIFLAIFLPSIPALLLSRQERISGANFPAHGWFASLSAIFFACFLLWSFGKRVATTIGTALSIA